MGADGSTAREGERISATVMIPAGDDHKVTPVHAVYKPVGLIDAARPEAGQILLEGCGLSDAVKGFSHAFPDQRVDPFEGLAILDLPELSPPRRPGSRPDA